MPAAFADTRAARQAVEMALPMIERAMRDAAVCGSGCLHIVVLDPALSPLDGSFDDAVLYEHSIGERAAWDADYAGFARAKARLSWRSGVDSHRVQSLQPQRLRDGDSLLWGSVCLDGIVVGVSGAHPWWDEAFACAVAANLRALAKARSADAAKAGQLYAGGGASTARRA